MYGSKVVRIDLSERFWESAAYEAGFQARLRGVGESVAATASWRAGWQDADVDCRNRELDGQLQEIHLVGRF